MDDQSVAGFILQGLYPNLLPEFISSGVVRSPEMEKRRFSTIKKDRAKMGGLHFISSESGWLLGSQTRGEKLWMIRAVDFP